MMSAGEFFDFGPEPPWLVDACDGEVASPNFELEYSLHDDEASSSVPFLDLNHSNEAGPSNSAMQMDVDEVAHLSDPSFAHNPRQELERFLQHVNYSGSQGMRSAMVVSLEQQRSWGSRVTPNVPNRVPPRRLAAGPAPEQFIRACKKRKRSYA